MLEVALLKPRDFQTRAQLCLAVEIDHIAVTDDDAVEDR